MHPLQIRSGHPILFHHSPFFFSLLFLFFFTLPLPHPFPPFTCLLPQHLLLHQLLQFDQDDSSPPSSPPPFSPSSCSQFGSWPIPPLPSCVHITSHPTTPLTPPKSALPPATRAPHPHFSIATLPHNLLLTPNTKHPLFKQLQLAHTNHYAHQTHVDDCHMMKIYFKFCHSTHCFLRFNHYNWRDRFQTPS